jgi:hypothetical protein
MTRSVVSEDDAGMTLPTVTEISAAPLPVEPDPFLDRAERPVAWSWPRRRPADA